MINETIDNKKTSRIIVRLKDSDKKKIEQKAEKEDVSVSYIIRNMIKQLDNDR